MDLGTGVIKSQKKIRSVELTVSHGAFENPKTDLTITVKDVIADAMLQQIITRPAEYSVLATMNLNGITSLMPLLLRLVELVLHRVQT